MLKLPEVREAINEIGREELESLIDDFGEDMVEAALVCDIGFESIREAYQGEWSNDEDFVEELIGDTEALWDLPNYVHIDWERTARDVMMDYCEEDGYYFRCL